MKVGERDEGGHHLSTPTPPPPASTVPANAPIEEVADGQRLVIYAILIYILAVVLQVAVDPILGLVGLGGLVLAIIGLMKLATGMGWSTGVKILIVLLLFIPLISILTLAIVNARATERLKAAGYKVGLLGAKKPTG